MRNMRRSQWISRSIKFGKHLIHLSNSTPAGRSTKLNYCQRYVSFTWSIPEFFSNHKAINDLPHYNLMAKQGIKLLSAWMQRHIENSSISFKKDLFWICFRFITPPCIIKKNVSSPLPTPYRKNGLVKVKMRISACFIDFSFCPFIV